jgi:regulator of sigma E protease
MGFLLFLIVLGLLIFVHEFGHFIVAKLNKLNVLEFGFGFPPRAIKLFKKRETEYTLNWIPFGGFVKIQGENPLEAKELGDKKGSFATASRFVQAQILLAGVFFNMLFAWLLLSISFAGGFETVTSSESDLYNYSTGESSLVVLSVLPESPADVFGLEVGDTLLNINGKTDLTDVTLGDEINSSFGPVDITYAKEGKEFSGELSPEQIEDRRVIGVTTGMKTEIKTPFFKSVGLGFVTTYNVFENTLVSLYDLVAGAFTKADSGGVEIAGPIGIAGLVSDAAAVSIMSVLVLTAVISVNLAIFNMIPFPALDGGKLLIVIIEAIRKKPLNEKFVAWLNGIGFVVLILLMLVVVVADVIRVF